MYTDPRDNKSVLWAVIEHYRPNGRLVTDFGSYKGSLKVWAIFKKPVSSLLGMCGSPYMNVLLLPWLLLHAWKIKSHQWMTSVSQFAVLLLEVKHRDLVSLMDWAATFKSPIVLFQGCRMFSVVSYKPESSVKRSKKQCHCGQIGIPVLLDQRKLSRDEAENTNMRDTCRAGNISKAFSTTLTSGFNHICPAVCTQYPTSPTNRPPHPTLHSHKYWPHAHTTIFPLGVWNDRLSLPCPLTVTLMRWRSQD